MDKVQIPTKAYNLIWWLGRELIRSVKITFKIFTRDYSVSVFLDFLGLFSINTAREKYKGGC